MLSNTFRHLRRRAVCALRRLDIRPVALHGGNLVSRTRAGRPVAIPVRVAAEGAGPCYVAACEAWATSPRRRAVR